MQYDPADPLARTPLRVYLIAKDSLHRKEHAGTPVS